MAGLYAKKHMRDEFLIRFRKPLRDDLEKMLIADKLKRPIYLALS